MDTTGALSAGYAYDVISYLLLVHIWDLHRHLT